MISGPRRTAMLVILAVFLVGIASGVAIKGIADDMGVGSSRPDRDASPGYKVDHPTSGREEDFIESLGLPKAQEKAVERLLEEREDRLEAYWEGKLPEIEALIDSSRVAIRNLLPPDARVAYDDWVARQRAGTPGD
jgi:hypothetical protein